MKLIKDIAESAGIPAEYLHSYGRHKAKIDHALLDDSRLNAAGKMILVTAMTPTSSGEGKTVTSIGLSQGLNRIGKRAVVTLREPSLGPVFGMKGGATGAGRSQVEPSEIINLHFTGDLHAITSAHNLLAAMIDAHIFHGNELKLDINTLTWPRAMDMNDRALRHIVIGLGGKANGVPRETGFVITAASEIMAVLALASSADDLRRRLSEIVVGYDVEGKPVRAGSTGAIGAMMALLADAMMPNLVQTTEETPAFVHCGPFANIAHGTSSVISQKMALKIADYVVNETGFAADLGAEKYFDIVMRSSGIRPSAAVIIATAKAIRSHGSRHDSLPVNSREAFVTGLSNLRKHIENVQRYGVPVVVAINRFTDDTEEDLKEIAKFCSRRGVASAVSDVFARGGDGAVELAHAVVAAAESADLDAVKPLYELEESYEEKIGKIAREIYGAQGVYLESTAAKKLKAAVARGFDHLPVCIAKTQSSLSDNPKLLGAPVGWTLTATDANVSAGAGFVVVIAGNMMLMPGLPKRPHAIDVDLSPDRTIVGVQ